jgi:hypothetical protein
MKTLIRAILRTLTALAIFAFILLATLWLTTRHSTVILRRIGNASQYRIAVRSGSLALSIARWEPSQPNNDSATYDLHVGAKWPLPEEWLGAPRNFAGVRTWTERQESTIERAWIIPLWLPLLATAVSSIYASARLRCPANARGLGRSLLRWARLLPAIACIFVTLLWVHSLFYRGWEFYSWPVNLFVEVHAPGALTLVTDGPEAHYSPSLEIDGEWSGWVCRLFAPLSTRQEPGSTTPTPWRPFPRFHHEPIYTQPVFVGERARLTAYEWTIPFWSLFLLTAPYPAVQVIGAVRRRRRLVQGLCSKCGYDLRATPETCPECGTPTISNGRA